MNYYHKHLQRKKLPGEGSFEVRIADNIFKTTANILIIGVINS